MSVYAIGDLHLSLDPRINKPMDIFGPAWHGHHLNLQEKWLAKVKPEDTVIIVGDISWGLRLDEALLDLRWISRLPGYKVITKGNHDLWWTSTNKMNSLFDNIFFLQNKAVYLENEDVFVCGSRGWITPGTRGFDSHDEKIYKRELLRLEMSLNHARTIKIEKGLEDTAVIAAIHYPPAMNKSGSGFTDILAKHGVKKCVYGHLHGVNEHSNSINGVINGVEYDLVALDYINADPKIIW